MFGKVRVERIPPGIAGSREAVADFRKLADVHLVPVLIELLPEVPKSRNVEAGVRPISPALHQGSGHLARDLSPLSLLCRLLHFPDTPAPQVVPETTRGAALVMQEEKLLTRQRLLVGGDPQLAQS